MRRLALPLVLVLLASCAAAPPRHAWPAFDLEAHRGGRGLSPENTLPAFRRALALGVSTLELDTAITADDVVVISHDPFVNPDLARAPDGHWLAVKGPAIRTLTYEQLARFDVGRLNPKANYGRRYPEQQPVDGTRIPRLRDLFALVAEAGASDVRFNIETKVTPTAPEETLGPEDFARRVVAEVRRGGMAHRTTIQSFDWRTLQVVQREAPELPTVYLTARQRFLDNVCSGVGTGVASTPADSCGPSAWTAGFQLREHGTVPRLVNAAGGAAWSPFFGDLDAAQVAEAHALGLRVIPWTVNEPEQMERLVEMGVDGIITDRPDLLRKVMAARGMKLP